MKSKFQFIKSFFVTLTAIAALFCVVFSSGCTQEEIDELAGIIDEVGSIVLSSEQPETSKPETSETEEAETEKPAATSGPETTAPTEAPVDEHGVYDSKEEVALYIYVYGKLPENYITKKEAKALGWEGGSVEKYASGKCIGGDYFGNYEGLLPEDEEYRECDIDTLGKSSRGAKRIIFSDDGDIYYTDDHYESFVVLYGEELP